MVNEPPGDVSKGQLLHPPASVLIVDDEEAIARQLADGLAALGYRVQAVGAAAEALQAIERDDDISVVVTDIRMPGGDGFSLARDIAARRPEESAVELVLITGHASLDDAGTAVRSGVCDFLRKPFRLRDVGEAVARAQSRAAERRNMAAARRNTERRLQETERERAALNGSLLAARELLTKLVTADPEGEDGEARAELAAISHALRTPLSAVSGGSELLEPGVGAPLAREGLDLLREGVRAAVEAVEAVEEFHRVRRIRMPSASSPVAVADVLRAAPAMSAPWRPDGSSWEGRRGRKASAPSASPRCSTGRSSSASSSSGSGRGRAAGFVPRSRRNRARGRRSS